MSAIRLDLGCGPTPKEGYQGVDVRDYGRTDILVCDLRGPWKWDDGSVDAVYSHHFIEHLTARERIHFANELWRVLKRGGTAEIIVPHWCSGRAFGDLTRLIHDPIGRHFLSNSDRGRKHLRIHLATPSCENLI